MIERNRHIELRCFGWMLGVMGLCLMVVGCSDDDDDDEVYRGRGIRFETVSMISDMGDEPFSTRALTGYSQFTPSENATAAESQIGVFMATSDRTSSFTGTTGTFNYSKSESKWETFFEESSGIETGTYYIYGFMPADAGTASMTSTDFTKGGVIKLENVNPISNADICAIVGVASNKDGLTEGSYSYSANGSGETTNYLALALNHVCSRVQIYMSIGTAYSSLRSVKIKSISMSATAKKGTMEITVPTTESPALTATFTQSTETTEAVKCSSVDLSLEYTNALASSYNKVADFFCPPGVKEFEMTTTYDLYDSSGNTLLYENRSATNKITMTKAFDLGMSYDLKITVTPTYLYHIKSEDMDNPEFLY